MAGLTSPLLLLIFMQPVFATGKLSSHFYEKSCPVAEAVVRRTVEEFYLIDRAIVPGLIRLHFHDCFVRGCDGSVLLDVTPSGEPVEKSSPGNFGLRGEEVIDSAKLQLEKLCPGTVSCADILAYAARDAAAIAGISSYAVPSGRRDGTVSRASDISRNLPAPFFSAKQQARYFRKKGFSVEEMVVLSGAHSIGGAHCSSFDYRLHNFTAGKKQDPLMDLGYAEFLKQMCPASGGLKLGISTGALIPNKKVDFGLRPSLKLNGSYYSGLLRGLGLLESDQALMKDKRARKMVKKMAKHRRQWSEKFAVAMIKLGKLGVLTGDEGEVRRTCRIGNRSGRGGDK